MKKMKIILFFAPALILFVLVSCQDPFLLAPQFPSGGATGGRGGIRVPEGVRASHGERRSITLTWSEDPNAVLYYIYNADTPLDSFKRCGETRSTQFKLSVSPGSTKYYRVSSVSYNGTESAQSGWEKGTSLAQPVISDITDITESNATVTWWMDNDSDTFYKNNLLYIVYCYNGSNEKAQIALDGSVISENRVVFKNLEPNTNYEYVVEAYLRGDQDASEKSDRMNKATARRFRPGAPRELKASRGAARDRITISFELPDMVDIALGENQYDPKPLYFVIFKRFYSESGNNEYQKACSYFGSMAGKGGIQFTDGYIPGAPVTWSDPNVSRGVKYEYMVQSYVDDTSKVISSDASNASATGWAVSEANLLFGEVDYAPRGASQYTSAILPINFDFNPQDVPYEYILKEKIEPLGGDDNDPDGELNREETFKTYDAIRAYKPRMNLTEKTTPTNPGRGLYSYEVEIRLGGEILDTISPHDKIEISEDTEPIIVENFRVQDGYTNQFELKWDNYPNRKYMLYIVDDKGAVLKEFGPVNDDPVDIPTASLPQDKIDKNYSYSYTAPDIIPGVTRYFAIKPYRNLGNGFYKAGQMKYYSVASRTLGVPELLPGADSTYSSITVAWTEAQKADTYRVEYRYTGETDYKIAEKIKKEKLTVDASGNFKYTFKPEGNEIDIAKAGKEIQIKVYALNEGLRALVGGDKEISTFSDNEVKTCLVGPAELGLSASKASSAQEIAVSWNKITGADGYYVFRRKFNMYNTAEEGTETVAYYVPADEKGTINITGKNLALDSNGAKTDTTKVKATASFASARYTLKDIYMPDSDYDGSMYDKHTPAYRSQQNDMIRGNPYRYWVVPVINGTEMGSIEFVYNKDSANKNTDIASYTIQESGATIKYKGAAADEKNKGTGFTFGFGQDVIATKGTYSSNGSANDGIKITWTPPPLLATVPGFTPKYTVYRRSAINEGTWSGWTEIPNISASQYIDVQDQGVNYQYIVGITNGSSSSDPRVSARFINESYGKLDEKGRPKMVGFMLGKVRLVSVSRDARSDGQGSFGEEVTWSNGGLSVDGYTVYLLNRNVNNGRQWTECDTVSGNTLSVFITNKDNRLKVLRDYKHYYKVRSYVLNEVGNKIYGPDPMSTYTWTQPDSLHEPYVRWGARQISADEFAAITALSIGTGMNWAGNQTSDVPDRHDAGSVSISESNVGYNREIKYSNSTPYFITINGSLHGYCTATQNTPTEYGADCAGAWGAASGAKDHLSTLTITGPGSEVNNMYSGTVKILRLGSGAGTGPYKVSYNGVTDLAVEAKHYRECFTFTAGSKNYKRTRNFDWSPSGGIAGTSPDKWWYPVTGTRAGWD
jgi:fibronectin type 3 domain-containing protein